MATHSNILAWKIPRTEEPGRLQPMGSQRVRLDLARMQKWLKDGFQKDLNPFSKRNVHPGNVVTLEELRNGGILQSLAPRDQASSWPVSRKKRGSKGIKSAQRMPSGTSWRTQWNPSQADRVIQPGTFTGTGGQAGDSLLGGHDMILYMYLKEPTCTADVCWNCYVSRNTFW